MLVLIGYLVVIASVFGGFALAGGHLAALFQPIELLMIGGAAAGAFVVGNNTKSLKATLRAIPTLFRGSKLTQARYLELLALLSELLGKARKEGMMAIERDIESPEESPVFSGYPGILADHHATDFICDYLRLMVAGNTDVFQIENLMDTEIETHHHEAVVPAHCIAKLGDAMPAFGIVAAVMGVVHTMESIGLPPEELGRSSVSMRRISSALSARVRSRTWDSLITRFTSPNSSHASARITITLPNVTMNSSHSGAEGRFR